MTRTKTIHKRIISLLAAMVLCFVFCMPAFAAEDDTAIEPRFPGYAGLYSVKVYPANWVTQKYDSNIYTLNNSGTGRDQILNVTLNNESAEYYKNRGCNGFYVEVTYNCTGATRYELYKNGVRSENGGCAGSTDVKTFYIANDTPSTWRLTLYDTITPAQGKPLSGNIYLS